jgi:transcriptional regulator with XRE-family HTH domain
MIISDMTHVGDMVRRRRVDRGLSQSELAAMTGTTRQWVSRFEQGKNDVTVGRLLEVAAALDLALDLRSPSAITRDRTTWSDHVRENHPAERDRQSDTGMYSAGVASVVKAIAESTQRRREAERERGRRA